MTRRVLYITDVPESANSTVRMSRAMLLMMDMIRAGHDPRVFVGAGIDARIQMDYALESPDELPAGGCFQYELPPDDEPDKYGINEQAVMAEQITVIRGGE